MTENKTLKRVIAGVNYACTCEKLVEINGGLDVIEEFEIEDGILKLYCKREDYIFNFTDVQCKVIGARVEFKFIGDKTQKLVV